MYRLVSFVLLAVLICDLHYEGSSISLSPSGMVSVCPGGQVLLTCERMSGSFLFWTVSVPHLATRDTIVADQGAISTTALQFNGLHPTAFNVTRTSGNPLTSQMIVYNVITAINGSTIYCSENRNTNGAPAVTINVTNKDSFLNQLNITMMNHFLRSSVTVTLQWPREVGAVYSVSVSPLTEMNTAMSHDSIVINLTVSYNIQYNVSIASDLYNATTTRVLKYVTCDLPNHLLHDPVVVVSGSQDSPLIEGQFITYTCPPGFILNGSNSSVCTGNGEWEPDPRELDCIADCGVPLVDINVILNYNSTQEGSRSILILTCENDISVIKQIITMSCHSSGNWIPDPAQFTCSSSTTVPSEISLTTPVKTEFGTANLTAIISSTMIVVCVISSIVFLSIGYACGWFSHKHKQSRTRKAASDSSNTGPNEGSQLPPTPGPLYEELQQRSTPEHQDLVELKENVAYGPIIVK